MSTSAESLMGQGPPTEADALRAETASLRERLATAEAEREELREWNVRLRDDRGGQLADASRAERAALADAAALREQLEDVRRAGAAGDAGRADLVARLAIAEALALTNGEARGRAEAEREDFRARGLRATGKAGDFLRELGALKIEHMKLAAERDELRGLLERALSDVAWTDPRQSSKFTREARAFLAPRAAAIPEGKP